MSGDFDDFFRTAYPRLMARAVLLCGNRADAEDAVAQAFAEVARNWDTASGYDAPEAYLHVTMTRKVFRLRRQRLRQEEVAALELPVSPYATPHEAWAAKEVLAVVAGLPPVQRAVLVHCCLDGMQQAEVAKLLGIKRGTVAAHLHKARAAVAKKLGLVAARTGDGLVTAARETQDRLIEALRDAERWLADGFAADHAVRERVRAAVDHAQPRRWWRRG
ncbi:RNA polymerase sigma factor [Kutzneria kofuensis]|uniref:RNA polymerase sigma-70 factor (ECF subfamily) n=1 Tax=Kutzneria kofuensis TaxID=103725 RepID=A0A7W9KER2_9PSEU|nr:sigma-70 family RNA polymerase sigma factor [Kutzneria kofuensis]MBB5891272.1 RNA polymerase sigma-70 factor (ECF subfamily) [Kutzneria kofuensis]